MPATLMPVRVGLSRRPPRPGELGWLIPERQGRVQREEDHERYGQGEDMHRVEERRKGPL
jgi:hypothetical protein